MRAPDLVEPPDQREQRPVEAPLAHLVLLGVEVLLAARAHGDVLARLVPGVDAVARRERRREDEPTLEGRAAALLQRGVEDVGRVRPQVRAEERRPVAELLDELDELGLGVLPREVRVRLREAGLREQRHHRRARERLGEEHRLRVLLPDLLDQPLPERDGLGVRVVDAEHGDARVAPAQHDVANSVPEALAVGACPSRSCGCPGSAWAGSRRTSASRRGDAGTTPDARGARGGRASTGARGRAPAPSRARRSASTSAARSASLPSSGWMASCPPSGAADRPWAADVARRGPLGVVPALAVRSSDRVDRRQVDDVEAELGELGDDLCRRPPGRPRSGGRARTRRSPGHARARRRPRGTARSVPRRDGRPARAAAAASRHSSTVPSPNSAAPSASSPARSSWPAAILRSCSSSQPA